MQLWRHIEQPSKFSRADFLVARMPNSGAISRPAGGHRRPLELIIPHREPSQEEERSEDRHLVSGMKARVTLGSGAFEARVANLSSSGMMIACERIVPTRSQVSVEIDGCAPLPMTVRWVRGGRMGLEFYAETMIVAQAGVQQYILDAVHAGAGPEERGAGRGNALLWVCQLATGGGLAVARMRNISRTGALLSFGEDLAPITGETVTLLMGEASRFEAQVRWSCDGLAGLRFADYFPVEMLIDQPCARIVEPGGERAQGQDLQAGGVTAVRIDFAAMARPQKDYRPLTLRELYDVLYSPADPIAP